MPWPWPWWGHQVGTSGLVLGWSWWCWGCRVWVGGSGDIVGAGLDGVGDSQVGMSGGDTWEGWFWWDIAAVLVLMGDIGVGWSWW